MARASRGAAYMEANGFGEELKNGDNPHSVVDEQVMGSVDLFIAALSSGVAELGISPLPSGQVCALECVDRPRPRRSVPVPSPPQCSAWRRCGEDKAASGCSRKVSVDALASCSVASCVLHVNRPPALCLESADPRMVVYRSNNRLGDAAAKQLRSDAFWKRSEEDQGAQRSFTYFRDDNKADGSGAEGSGESPAAARLAKLKEFKEKQARKSAGAEAMVDEAEA